jgi:hypothetical protein
MTALRLEDQAGAHSAELAPLAVPDSARRQAGIVVCAQAHSANEARELLDMLGLLNPADLPQPVQAPAPAPKPAASRTTVATTPRPATAPATPAVKPRAAKPVATPVRIAPVVPDPEPAQPPITGECVGCGRSMITQKAYLRNPDWREKGFVRHASGDRCNGCYSAWRKRGGQATPRFAAHQVQIQPYYPVICQKCGPVGEPPTTREAANRIRDAHIKTHRQPQPTAAPTRHQAGHGRGLAEHIEKSEPLCPPCQELCDTLAAGDHLAPARRTA